MEEQAFLNALTANPLDHDHRLVYADWLDDHGQAEKAEFLRLEARFAIATEANDADEQRWATLVQSTQLAWREVAGRRYDVLLNDFDPVKKIRTIKVVYELTGEGLLKAVNLVDGRKPALVLANVLRELAVHAVRSFNELMPASASLRASGTNSLEPIGTPPPQIDVILEWFAPTHRQAVAQRIRELTGLSLPEVRRMLKTLPRVIHTTPDTAVADTFIASFDPAVVQFLKRDASVGLH